MKQPDTQKHSRTKIIATLGPASDSEEMMLDLINAGVDVFRLNFSHGSHAEHLARIEKIRKINKEHNCTISILQDLQGPKIRIGMVEGGQALLEEGKRIEISTRDQESTAQHITTIYKPLPKDVKPGDAILLDDGKLELRVISSDGEVVQAEVVYGGILKHKKGINLPNSTLSTPSLTEKDTEDLMFGLEHGVDWVALSFVRSAIDILLLKHLIKQKGKGTRVIAKLEKPEAISDENLDAIIEASDAIMVARGDLGVEIGIENVPIIQKKIVRKCGLLAKPVIIATQIMETMIDNPRPTRAEASDLANAVLDGADAVMLSGETAAGKYPLRVVQTMENVIRNAEGEDVIYEHNQDLKKENKDAGGIYDYKNDRNFTNNSVILSASRLATYIGAKAIVSMTSSGYTAFRLASHRPKTDIFVFTSNKSLLTQLNLLWGVRAFYYDKFVSTDQTFQDIQDILLEKGFVEKGDQIIQLASMPIEQKLRTNVIKLSQI
ncbi:MAG: pyruvate kinase [Bacteroidetes bacterium]|nr:MAG: pyruvate kinase [Bacteroidota bacterium]